jgi:filamentous hemagglutinin family protein
MHKPSPRSATSPISRRSRRLNLQILHNSGFWATSLTSIALLTSPQIALAQSLIQADGTLGGQSSQVIQNFNGTPADVITGGAQRGQNLFHSLREFNVDPGRFAYFLVPNAVVRNILARVTGSNLSNIAGTVGTLQPLPNGQFGASVPNVNLFLINPNGIIFGPGAALNMGGSFSATTTNAIEFGNQGVFSATNPSDVPVLTINPSAYLVNQIPVGRIVNRSRTLYPGLPYQVGLQVPDGESLTLLGGDVDLEGGVLSAWGGRMEIGAVAAAGRVEILPTGALEFAPGLARGNVTLTNGAQAVVVRKGGGDLEITAANIRLSGGSLLWAGIDTVGGTTATQAGTVRLDATGTIRVEGASVIQNFVYPTAVGSAGNIQIVAAALEVTGGSNLFTDTAGLGNAGNILIQVSDRALFENSNISSNVLAMGSGKGGNIAIAAGSLEVRNTQLSAITQGIGDAGNIQINVRDRALFQNIIASSSVERTGRGKGGNIAIAAGSLDAQSSSFLANTQGNGATGNIQLNARDRALFQDSIVSSNVEATGRGKGGDIAIAAGNLDVQSTLVFASTQGLGDAGNIQINAGDRALFQRSFVSSSVGLTGNGRGGNLEIVAGTVEVLDRAQLIADTNAQGDAGNILINARDRVLFQNQSVAFSDVTATARGNGGNVEIFTGTLEVREGAQLVATTKGIGDAGNVRITARDRVLFQGVSADGQIAASAFINVDPRGRGNGGNLEIYTGSLEVRDGAQLIAATQGFGDAGTVVVNARDRVLIDGVSRSTGRSSAIFTNNGNADVNLVGTGVGGDVLLTTPQLTLSNAAVIDARTANDKSGGNLTFNVGQLTLLSGGQIFSTSEGSGAAGTITLTASDQVRISGSDPSYGDRRAQFGTAVAPVTANSGLYVRSSRSGAAGNILLTTPLLTLDQKGRIDAESASGNGGNITLNVQNAVLLRNNSLISTTAGTAAAGGNGGNITINTRNGFVIGVLRENSDIRANAFTGSGGNINITAQGIYGLQFQRQDTPFSDITASSQFGVNGTVALDILNLDPSRGLVQLPVSLVDPSNKFDDRCGYSRGQRANSFTNTGRGGIAPSPMEPLMSDGIAAAEWVGAGIKHAKLGLHNHQELDSQNSPFKTQSLRLAPSDEIVEANAIARDEHGVIHLVAVVENAAAGSFWQVSPDCAQGDRAVR